MRRQAWFQINGPLLLSLLEFPSDIQIVAFREDPSRLDAVQVFIESERFPELQEGQVCPEATIWFERNETGRVIFSKIEMAK